MNVVNVVGGLGNQLFQYLFALALERESGTTSYFDISDFRHYTRHGGIAITRYFAVEVPPLPINFGTVPMLARSYVTKRALAKLAHYLGPLAPIETDRTFNLEQASRFTSRYFVGYWQSQLYTEEHLQIARKALQFHSSVATRVDRAEDATRIDYSRAAAVQVRRGDYLRLSPTAAQYALPADYYIRSISRLAHDHGVTQFWVFSDDVSDVRTWLRSEHDLVFVERDLSDSPGTDMCWISRFSYIVISNSSFGWWSSALRPPGDGLTVAPSPWLNPKFTGDASAGTRLRDHWLVEPAFGRAQ